MNGRILLLAAFPLLVASCNVQESTPPSAQEDVILAPRFAATATVPHVDSVTVVLKTESGDYDTSLTVRFVRGGPITLGKLPPGVRFTLTMKGWNNIDGREVVAWWTSTEDSSGSNTQRRITMPDPQQSAAPLDFFATGFADSTYDIVGPDTLFYQGKPITFPVGTFVTTDGSDPRTSDSRKPAGGSYQTDSVDTIKAAVMVEADPARGRPALWSPVKTFHLVVDSLDTLTGLNSLSLSTIMAQITSSSISMPPFQRDSLTTTATLASDLDLSSSKSAVNLYLHVAASSQKATVHLGDTVILSNTPTRILFPVDSTLELTVNNHKRSRTYQVKFASTAGNITRNLKQMRQLESSSPGLVQSSVEYAKEYSILLPTDQTRLVLYPAPYPPYVARFDGALLGEGDSIVLDVGTGTSSITIDIVDSAADPAPVSYVVKVNHVLTAAFRDTTHGVPWRDVPYDTLEYNKRKYRTVVVGTARWMAENLNYKVDSSFCMLASVDSCAKYGRVYTWSAAAGTTSRYDSIGLEFTGHLQGVCPAGWHLPSLPEWQTLIDLVGSDRAGALLRSHGGSWIAGGGLDSLGMRILPAGYRQVNFVDPEIIRPITGGDAWFWTSTQGASATHASTVRFSGTSSVASMTNQNKVHAISVRCVSDTAVVAP